MINNASSFNSELSVHLLSFLWESGVRATNMLPIEVVGILQSFLVIFKSVVLFFIPLRFRLKEITEKDVVLITGSGSGLGRELTLEFAKRGCRNIVLWDVNEAGMKETKALLSTEKCKVFSYVIDVTDKEAVYSTAKKVKEDVQLSVTYLVNNAGIVSGDDITEVADDKVVKTFQVNAISHFWTLKAFLPDMMAENRGHIVTIASLAGHIGLSKLVDYVSSKHAAVGTHRALSMELVDKGYWGIKTTCVCPYYIDTGMFSGVKTGLIPILKTGQVVRAAMRGILTNQDMVVIPAWMTLLLILGTILPTEVGVILADKVLQYSKSMHTFIGRGKRRMANSAIVSLD